jgi:uncharacterized membrane protein YeaQ/YmgE (transglycosylase-associated protein family)
MGTIFWTLIIGLAIGAVAKLLMPGKDPGGCIITILLGIAGAFVASYAGTKFGWEFGSVGSFVAAVIGAMVLLLLYRLIFRTRS